MKSFQEKEFRTQSLALVYHNASSKVVMNWSQGFTLGKTGVSDCERDLLTKQ